MPITCPITFQPLTTQAFGVLDYAVMAHAFASHQDLGSLADESVYQADFRRRLVASGFNVDIEVEVTAVFESFQKKYFLDLVINSIAVYELKTVATLLEKHSSQLLNYLLMLDLERGKLINFRPTSIESKFINAPLSGVDRRRFVVDTKSWRGPKKFLNLVLALVNDWGIGLEIPLYRQAIIHLLGGEESVSTLRQMTAYGANIGNQRFNLIDDCSAFGITAFSNLPSGYHAQLTKLLRHSTLRSFHWINIAHHKLTFTTVQNR